MADAPDLPDPLGLMGDPLEISLYFTDPPDVTQNIEGVEEEMNQSTSDDTRVDLAATYGFTDTVRGGETVQKLSAVVVKIRADDIPYNDINTIMGIIETEFGGYIRPDRSIVLT